MTWKETLLFIAGLPNEVFTTTTVAKKFNVRLSRASTTINTLRRWGYVKYNDRTVRGYGGFVVTPWGKQMATKWRAEHGEGGQSSTT